MGLFDKKYCEFCGEKIGFLGNKKLSDGNMCKNCASKMSPWLEDRKHWTVDEMRNHFMYRDDNYEKLRNFKITGVIGRDHYRMYLDNEKKQFFICQYDNYMDCNPDIFSYNQVKGIEYEVKENRRELYFRDSEGHNRSYSPAEYDFSYDFYVKLYVSDFLVDYIRFKLNRTSVEEEMDPAFREFEDSLDCIREVCENMIDGRDFRIPRQMEIDSSTRRSMLNDMNRWKNDRRRYLDDYARDYNSGRRAYGRPVGREPMNRGRGGRNYY